MDCAVVATDAQLHSHAFVYAVFSKIIALACMYLLFASIQKNSNHRLPVIKVASTENILMCSFSIVREILAAPWSVSTMAGWHFMGLSAGEMAVQRKTSPVFTPELLATLTGLTLIWMQWLPKVTLTLNQSDHLCTSGLEQQWDRGDARTPKPWISEFLLLTDHVVCHYSVSDAEVDTISLLLVTENHSMGI